MSNALRVGVLGAGWAGSSHAAAFGRLPDVEVAALWNRTRSRAERMAMRLNLSKARIYDDWRELIEKAQIDVLSIATPETFRLEPVTMAINNGCHVLVEKPFSVQLEDARKMMELASGANTVTASCFSWRYSPGSQVARRQVEAGCIGQVVDISMEWRRRITPRVALEERRHTSVGVHGPIAHGGSHEFDRARFLTGSEFVRVVGRVLPQYLSNDPDFVVPGASYMLVADLTENVSGSFRCAFTGGQADWRVFLTGEEGTLNVTHGEVMRQRVGDAQPESLAIPLADCVADDMDPAQYGWNRLIEDFCLAIREGDLVHALVPSLPTFDDGFRSQQVICAALRSQDENSWISVDHC